MVDDMSFCRSNALRKFKEHGEADVPETEIKTNFRRVNRVRFEPNAFVFVCKLKGS